MQKYIGTFFKRKNISDDADSVSEKRFCQNSCVRGVSEEQNAHDSEGGDAKGDIPVCWTPDPWTLFKGNYSWLFSKNGGLGCITCAEVETLGASSLHQGVHLAPEWTKGLIGIKGKGTKQVQQKQLRKKYMSIKTHIPTDVRKKLLKVKDGILCNKLWKSRIPRLRKSRVVCFAQLTILQKTTVHF